MSIQVTDIDAAVAGILALRPDDKTEVRRVWYPALVEALCRTIDESPVRLLDRDDTVEVLQRRIT